MAKSKSLCQTLLPKMWKRHSEPWRWCTPFAFCKDLTTQYWNLGHFQPNQTNLQYKIRRETYTKNHQGTHHTQQIHHIPFCYHLKTISFPKQQRINPVSYNKSFVKMHVLLIFSYFIIFPPFKFFSSALRSSLTAAKYKFCYSWIGSLFIEISNQVNQVRC